MEEQVRAFLSNLETQLSYSSSTRMAYQNDLRCFINYLENEFRRPPSLADFSARQVADFLRQERSAGRHPSTLLRRRASIRSFARFLKTQYPHWAAAFQKEAFLIDEALSTFSSVQKPRSLTTTQVQALMNTVQASPRLRARRDQAILALLFECGLSVGTLTGLNFTDVNIETAYLRLHHKGQWDSWLSLGEAAAPMRKYLLEVRPELSYQAPEPALFISQTGGRMSRQGVWQAIRQWGRRAGLEVTLSPRLVRHTAAYHLAHSGRPLEEIQALLGHRNPLSTRALFRRLETKLRE
jgi:integrase/recombinase XerD